MHTGEHRVRRSTVDIARRGRPRLILEKTWLGDAFWVELLGGREVWPAERRSARGSRWFVIGKSLIELRPMLPMNESVVELEVDSPEDLLERAWNAGYRVEVREDHEGVSMAIVDPEGRRVRLIQR